MVHVDSTWPANEPFESSEELIATSFIVNSHVGETEGFRLRRSGRSVCRHEPSPLANSLNKVR